MRKAQTVGKATCDCRRGGCYLTFEPSGSAWLLRHVDRSLRVFLPPAQSELLYRAAHHVLHTFVDVILRFFLLLYGRAGALVEQVFQFGNSGEPTRTGALTFSVCLINIIKVFNYF